MRKHRRNEANLFKASLIQVLSLRSSVRYRLTLFSLQSPQEDAVHVHRYTALLRYLGDVILFLIYSLALLEFSQYPIKLGSVERFLWGTFVKNRWSVLISARYLDRHYGRLTKSRRVSKL